MVYSCYGRFLLFSLSSTFSNVKILSFIGGPWFPKRQNCWLGFVIEHRVQIFPGNSGTGHFSHWPLSESCKGKPWLFTPSLIIHACSIIRQVHDFAKLQSKNVKQQNFYEYSWTSKSFWNGKNLQRNLVEMIRFSGCVLIILPVYILMLCLGLNKNYLIF